MSQIIEEIDKRRARRGLSENAIPADVVERIFTAGTYAPSCSNKQPWRFLVCNEGQALENARDCLNGGNYWAKLAPMLVVVTTRDALDCHDMSDDRNYAQFDTGMAVMGILMQATREGLIAHPMAGFDPLKVREHFGIEPETRVITMIAIAYPGETGHLSDKHKESEVSERSRKPLSEVVMFNEWTAPA